MRRRSKQIAVVLVSVVAALSVVTGVRGDTMVPGLAETVAGDPAPPAEFERLGVLRAYTVPSRIVSDCTVDVTAPVTRFIRRLPDRSKIVFRAGGCYAIEGTVGMRDRVGLVVEGNGARFRSALPPDDQRAIWRVVDSRGIVFRDMSVQGSYQWGGSHDVDLQHAHGIDLRGSAVEVAHVTFSDLAGDCVYFGLDPGTRRRSSGYVHDVSCVRTSRNGVSVTAGDDVLVERFHADMIGLTAFDIEPNEDEGFGSARVAIRACTVGRYSLYAYALIGNRRVTDQSFTDNRFLERRPRIAILGPYAPERVLIRGNAVVDDAGRAAASGGR